VPEMVRASAAVAEMGAVAMDELPLRTIHVNVRLEGPWRTEWRQVMARDLYAAHLLAEMMPDVKQVCEVSFVAGGVIT